MLRYKQYLQKKKSLLNEFSVIALAAMQATFMVRKKNTDSAPWTGRRTDNLCTFNLIVNILLAQRFILVRFFTFLNFLFFFLRRSYLFISH